MNYDEINGYLNSKKNNTSKQGASNNENVSPLFNVGAYPLQVVGDFDDNADETSSGETETHNSDQTSNTKRSKKKSDAQLNQSEIDTTLLYSISESLDKNNELLSSIKSMLKYFVILSIVSIIIMLINIIRILSW